MVQLACETIKPLARVAAKKEEISVVGFLLPNFLVYDISIIPIWGFVNKKNPCLGIFVALH